MVFHSNNNDRRVSGPHQGLHRKDISALMGLATLACQRTYQDQQGRSFFALKRTSMPNGTLQSAQKETDQHRDPLDKVLLTVALTQQAIKNGVLDAQQRLARQDPIPQDIQANPTNSGQSLGAKLPVTLYVLLSAPELREVLAWSPDGRAWTIPNLPAFRSIILPLFGSSSCDDTFMRLLHVWGFRQFTKGNGPDAASSFYRDCFVRGRPELLAHIAPSLEYLKRPFHDRHSESDAYTQVVTNKASMEATQTTGIKALAALACAKNSQLSQGTTDLSVENIVATSIPFTSCVSTTVNDMRATNHPITARFQQKIQFPRKGLKSGPAAPLPELCRPFTVAQTMRDPGAFKVAPPPPRIFEAVSQVTEPRKTADTPVSPRQTRARPTPTTEQQPPKKKPRKKWLPPLGPTSPDNKDASFAWIYTSPELFASLAADS